MTTKHSLDENMTATRIIISGTVESLPEASSSEAAA